MRSSSQAERCLFHVLGERRRVQVNVQKEISNLPGSKKREQERRFLFDIKR